MVKEFAIFEGRCIRAGLSWIRLGKIKLLNTVQTLIRKTEAVSKLSQSSWPHIIHICSTTMRPRRKASRDFWYDEQRLPELRTDGTWKKKSGESGTNQSYNEVKVKANVGPPSLTKTKLP